VIRDGAIEHVVEYDVPPERVWRALVDTRELASWLMPNDFEPVVGHRFSIDARPQLGIIDAEVLELDAPRLLRCSWSGPFGDTTVTFELTPTTTGTRLRLTHTGWTDDEHRPGFNEGWAAKLEHDLPRALKEGTTT
jgi:uncharacterized protein YndB with AHSA1/START domain